MTTSGGEDRGNWLYALLRSTIVPCIWGRIGKNVISRLAPSMNRHEFCLPSSGNFACGKRLQAMARDLEVVFRIACDCQD